MFAEVIAEEPTRLVYGRNVRDPAAAYGLASRVLRDCPTEEFWAIHVNGKHYAFGMAQVSVGTLTTSLVHPREVFGPAIRMGAAALIVVHNHPSGDPEPSLEDVDVTRRLTETGRILGIPLLDHIVCGDARYVSLRERGVVT